MSACDHRAVFQVMGFCVVTCKQPAEKEKQRRVKLPPQRSRSVRSIKVKGNVIVGDYEIDFYCLTSYMYVAEIQ